jgi:hypothetical protein
MNKLQEKFTHVYENNGFNGIESLSGTGSGVAQTRTILLKLPELFVSFGIKILVDAPCGDMFWMSELLANNTVLEKYIGVDIVKKLIVKNRQQFANDIISFECLNIVDDIPPKGDLILCRDCLAHLTFEEAKTVISNFKKSGSRYLLTTTYPEHALNAELVGCWRSINLQTPPYNFPEPIAIINENCTEVGGSFSDKSLALWDLNTVNYE